MNRTFRRCGRRSVQFKRHDRIAIAGAAQERNRAEQQKQNCERAKIGQREGMGSPPP